MSPDSEYRFVDGTDRYKNWHNERRSQAFIEAVHSHAVADRPYSANLREHVDLVMALFDKHFPIGKKG